MLIQPFKNVLHYDTFKTKADGKTVETLQEIQFKQFENSKQIMERIKEANLEKYIGESVEVESKYSIKHIVGYGATSVVYKAGL